VLCIFPIRPSIYIYTYTSRTAHSHSAYRSYVITNRDHANTSCVCVVLFEILTVSPELSTISAVTPELVNPELSTISAVTHRISKPRFFLSLSAQHSLHAITTSLLYLECINGGQTRTCPGWYVHMCTGNNILCLCLCLCLSLSLSLLSFSLCLFLSLSLSVSLSFAV